MPGDTSTSPGKASDAGVPWCAIHTRCHHEVRLEKRLPKRGAAVFLSSLRQPSFRCGRKKILHIPSVPDYLLVHDGLETITYHDITKLTGGMRNLSGSGRLQPVTQETSESIRLVLAGNYPDGPHCYPKKRGARAGGGWPPGGVGGIIVEAKEKKRKTAKIS